MGHPDVCGWCKGEALGVLRLVVFAFPFGVGALEVFYAVGLEVP